MASRSARRSTSAGSRGSPRRRALDLVGLSAAEAVAIEDTEAGSASAKAAGVRCIALRGTLPDERLAAADEIVDAIDVALLARLLAS